jgi:hypothetical protein
MRILIAAVVFTSLTGVTRPTSLFAQVHGYAIAGPAGALGFVNTGRTTFHAAGGGEFFLGKYVSVDGEGGFFDRLITASVNGALHVADGTSMSPFLTAGYTRMGIHDGEGGFNAWNVGAGADAWIGRHAGIRFELRDHLRPDHRGTTNYWSFRAGVVFR